MKILTVDRSKWVRTSSKVPEGSLGACRLMNTEGNMCINGMDIVNNGANPDDMMDVWMPGDSPDTEGLCEYSSLTAEQANEARLINDKLRPYLSVTDEEQETSLRKLFKEAGVQLRFTN